MVKGTGPGFLTGGEIHMREPSPSHMVVASSFPKTHRLDRGKFDPSTTILVPPTIEPVSGTTCETFKAGEVSVD